MTLKIESEAIEKLAAEVAELTGETTTETIRKALEERKLRLTSAATRLREFLEREIWSQLPAEKLGGPPLRKEEREALLGLGPAGTVTRS